MTNLDKLREEFTHWYVSEYNEIPDTYIGHGKAKFKAYKAAAIPREEQIQDLQASLQEALSQIEKLENAIRCGYMVIGNDIVRLNDIVRKY